MTLLAAWIWQALLLVAIVALVFRVFPRANAATRHAAWWLALVAVILLPLLPGTPDAPHRAPASSGDPLGISGHVPTGDQHGPMPAERVSAAGLQALSLPALPWWATAALLGVWAGSVVLGLARLARSVAALHRLKTDARTMPAAVQAALPSWLACRNHGRRVELRLSDRLDGPCAVGLGSPMILIPRALADAFDADALDAIVIHEYAHLARFDDWTRLAQRVVHTFIGLHPAVQLIARRIDLEREAACDDWVVRRTMRPSRYAAHLTDLAALMIERRTAAWNAVAPGAFGSRRMLHTRVSRLLDPGLDRGRRLGRSALASAALGLAGAACVAAGLQPIVVFGETAAAVEAARPRHGGSRELPPAGAVTPATGAAKEAPAVAGGARAPRARAAETAALAANDAGARERPYVAPVAEPARQNPSTLAARPVWAFPQVAPDVHAGSIEPDSPRDVAPWTRTARAGTVVGIAAAQGGTSIARGAKKAGSSVAGFFGRAGQAVAGSF